MVIQISFDVVNIIPADFVIGCIEGIVDDTIAIGMSAAGAGFYSFLKI